jgi:transposase InsO family protein
MKDNKLNFSITTMCKVLKVKSSSYYHWCRTGCIVEKVDEELNSLIQGIFKANREVYGQRRIKEALTKKYGIIVSKRRIGNIMKSLNLIPKMRKKFKVNTTDSNHNLPIASNILDRDFYSGLADTKYVGDITYIHTAEGWLYLATVIDLFSRKVVGWSMDDHMRVSLVNDALEMAIQRRKPPIGLIWHTDRGSQYASNAHRDLLQAHSIIQSMSRKGNCWDNAVAESFFHSLKTECTNHEMFRTRAQANQKIFEYIEVFYNRERMHSSNNYLSPVEYEEKMLLKEMGA